MSHHHDHAHAVSADADAGKLTLALVLICTFMAAEVVVGIIASSLALLSDAAHMLTDAAAIALSLVAVRLAARPARGAMTYGLGRAEILSAQVNGITLLVLGAVILFEAIQRLVHAASVNGGLVLATALIGVAVNLLVAWVLARANRRNLSVEGSFQHIVTDLYAFMATGIAAAVILATGFDRADAIASLFVATLMFRSAFGLLKASGRVFLEAAPRGIDPDEIGMALAAQPGVAEVHDLHVWEVTSGFPALSAHVLVTRDTDCHAKRRELTQVLHERFNIDHSTLQVDHEGGELLTIEDARHRAAGDRGRG